MAAEHDALQLGVGCRHRAELEAEVEARPLPGQQADLVAEDLFASSASAFAGGNRDHRVGMDMVDMRVRNKAVQRRVDRGRARVEIERAVVEERHHLVLVREPAIEALQAEQLVQVEGREAVELHRADIAARALDPEHLDRLAGQRVLFVELGRGVAAAEIGDAQVAAEQVRAVEQQARRVEAGRVRVVPQIGQRRIHGPITMREAWPLMVVPPEYRAIFERSLSKPLAARQSRYSSVPCNERI